MKKVLSEFSIERAEREINNVKYRTAQTVQLGNVGWTLFENALAFTLLKSKSVKISCSFCELSGKPAAECQFYAHDAYGYQRHINGHFKVWL